MVNTQSYQRRFDVGLETLALTFTDLVVLVEALDKRLEALEHASAAQHEQITYLRQQLAARGGEGGGGGQP